MEIYLSGLGDFGAAAHPPCHPGHFITPTYEVPYAKMQPSPRLLQNTIRLTLFMRPNCGLCDSAKVLLQNLGRRKRFAINHIDVMHPTNLHWKALYEFDTPVVSIQESVLIGKIKKIDQT